MATVVQHMGHTGRDTRSGPVDERRHGRGTLAEVISIPTESQSAQRPGILGSLVTMARGFTSRVQAASVRSTPHPPSSPALRPQHHPDLVPLAPAPHDAA